MLTRLQFRQGTEAEWTAADPVLAAGEPGYIVDRNEFVLGDEATAFSELPRFGIGASLADVGYDLRTGHYVTAPPFGTMTTRAFTAQRLHASPLPLKEGGTADRIAASVATAATSGTGRLGIYNDDGGVPGTLVLDAGTINLASATKQEIIISQALSAGFYWLAVLVENLSGAGALQAAAGRYPITSGDDIGALSAAINGRFADGVAAGALPDPFPAATRFADAPLVALRF